MVKVMKMVRVVILVKVVRAIREPAFILQTKKQPRTQTKNLKISKDYYDSHDALAFGRPGCGAPARTKSGRIRTTLIGNPDIRLMVMMMMMVITLIMMMVREGHKLQPSYQVPGQRGCAKVDQQQYKVG